MARALRVQFEGAIYHVTSRGNERRQIFRTPADRERFVGRLFQYVETHHIRLYAYVLMSNHYHLLFETPRANLSAFMHQLNGAYTIYFNRKHRRKGHLFAGRYKAKLVEDDEYLLKLTRYIHLNPVKIRTMSAYEFSEKRKRLRRYRWSSYRSYAGLAKRQQQMDYGPLSELVGQGRAKKALAYRHYVEAALTEDDEELKEALSRSSKAIGLEPFCRWVEEAYQKVAAEQGQRMDVAMRRLEVPAPAEVILDAVCAELKIDLDPLRRRRSRSDARTLAMKLLNEEGGLTQREVAAQLNYTDGSTVSRRLAEISHRMKSDQKLRRQHAKIQARINANTLYKA